MRAVLLLTILATSLGAGCATRSAGMRAENPQPTAAPPAPVQPVAKPVVHKRPALPVKKVAPAHRARAEAHPLDQSLKRFMAIRQAQPRRRASSMPPAVQHNWHAFLDDVETAVVDSEHADDASLVLGLFIRAHVTLDAEWDLDRRRYKTLPPDLLARQKEAMSIVASRVKTLREESRGFALRERLESDGPLVLQFPVQIVNVTSYFGHRRDPIKRRQTRFHAGVDLGGANGALIQSAGPGIVAYADWQGGSGNHVIVVHANGYRTHYSHLSKILVRQGDMVDVGTPLGLMGETGRATGPHLHFAVSRNGAFLDPLDTMNVPLTSEGPQVPQS